jgi:signal transduction histidine kinase/ActR/RegA family two-component response regulator
VATSSLQSRSASLSAQLIVTFVMLLAATVAGLTLVADRSALDNLEAQAKTAARTAAQTRSQLLSQLLALRLRRAQGFLVSAESFCTEDYTRQLYVYAGPCIRSLLGGFKETEHARRASLNYRNRHVVDVGGPVPARTGAADGSFLIDTTDGVMYVTQATHRDSVLALEFDSSDIEQLFGETSGLGTKGEVFLIDGRGQPLTRPRYGAPSAPLLSQAQSCDDHTSSEGRNYRGQPVIAAFTPVAALPGACIVAYMDYEEAFAPASDLRLALVTRGGIFILAGVLMSLIAAHYIAGPVRRLAATARALQAGDFSQPVPVDGPAEVQGLGRAVAAMATDLAELLSQEQTGRRNAEAANRSKDQFLAMLSHELRTPLTAVLGWAHTLRTGTYDSERVQRAATAIERSAESQRRLIEDLLDVTGIAAGRVRMNLEPTRLVDAVEAAIEAVGPRASEKGVRIDTRLDDPHLTIQGDSQRLQQVVWNLVWNAVKFTPPGGTITVRVRAVGALAELTVSDTGVGIDPEFLPHVFGWFRREDREERGVDEGLGLGLALVRQLVEMHGGSVRASSDGRNNGSTFIVTLPLTEHTSPVAIAPRTTDDAMPANPLASVRVLVVDDDPGSREAVRVLLEQVGAEVSTASSAADARRQLRIAAADVLVSDIAMAQESGYTLMETIRAEGLTLPSVALTGYARREDADKAYAAGFDVHLPKPVDPGVLVSVLAAMTHRSA